MTLTFTSGCLASQGRFLFAHRQWSIDSFKYFDQLLFSPEGGKAGIFQASGYQMFDDERQVTRRGRLLLLEAEI